MTATTAAPPSPAAAFLATLKKPEACATPVTVAFGDGIGPEIMQASLENFLAAGAKLALEPIDIGERVYLSGNSAGLRRSVGQPAADEGLPTRRRSPRRRAAASRASM